MGKLNFDLCDFYDHALAIALRLGCNDYVLALLSEIKRRVIVYPFYALYLFGKLERNSELRSARLLLDYVGVASLREVIAEEIVSSVALHNEVALYAVYLDIRGTSTYNRLLDLLDPIAEGEKHCRVKPSEISVTHRSDIKKEV